MPKSSKQAGIFSSENLIYKLQHRIRIYFRLPLNFIGNILEICEECRSYLLVANAKLNSLCGKWMKLRLLL